MSRLNPSSFFISAFFILFSLSFFHTDFDDFSVLLISWTIMLLSFLTFGLNFFSKKEKLNINIVTLLFSLWFISISLPIVLNAIQSTAQYGLFQCSVWIFAFVIIASHNNFEKNWHQFKKLICILAFIFSLWAIIQHYGYNHMATGPFHTRNSNGAFLMLAALIVCSEFLSDKRIQKSNVTLISRYHLIIYTVLFFIMNLGLLLSFSRGVYLSYGCSLLFLFIFNANRSSIKNIILLSTVILLALIFLYSSALDSILHRLEILEQEKSRLIIWKGAWHLWQQAPWYGIGIGNFKYFYHAFSLPGDGSSLESAHNDYLQLLIETGIPGISISFALFLIFFYYSVQYLKNRHVASPSYIAATTQMAAILSLVMYGFVDFVFYLFPFNILLGVLLGFLYQNLNNQNRFCFPRLFTKTDYKKTVSIFGAGIFLLVTNLFLHLLLYSYYTNQADYYISQERLSAATKSYYRAKHYFNSPYLYNKLASLYLEQAKKTTETTEKIKLIVKAEHVIAETIALHPYNPEPYFQQGIIQSLYYKDNAKAQTAFEMSIQLKPHANFERLTFCFFLLEQDQFFYAQKLLEEGLLYPIDPYYALKYLELLANLRLDHGDKIGAQQIVEALSHVEIYRFNFSALATSSPASM